MVETCHRILMTVDPIGGVWTYALTLVRGLVRRGCAVALASMGAPLMPEQRAAALEVGATLFVSERRLEWMDDPWDDVDAAGEWLLELAERWRPDVVHLNGYAHAALPWGQPVLVVAHSCVLSWWDAVRGDAVPDKYREYHRRVSEGLNAARWIVAPTRAMLDALYEQYGPTGLQSVIYNGADPVETALIPRQDVILSVGRLWDRTKNTELLASIADQLPWAVALAGESRAPGHRPAEVWPSVRMLGRLEPAALGAWYAKAGIFALPALYEPFGLSVLEAAQRGCPLVLGDIPSLRELWEGAAVFVSPSDPLAWCRALQRLAADASWRAQLGAASRHCARRFTAAAMVERYLQVYNHLTLPQHVHSFAT